MHHFVNVTVGYCTTHFFAVSVSCWCLHLYPWHQHVLCNESAIRSQENVALRYNCYVPEQGPLLCSNATKCHESVLFMSHSVLFRTNASKVERCLYLTDPAWMFWENHNQLLFFNLLQATARGEGMTLLFMCCNPDCGNRWREWCAEYLSVP